ncbi:DeoR/GlpR family DNA-binding transcription regulator [Solicola gregarius]|uniref:Lactose phosphotransferase system repressor n=1 Tax=Solicola gregarius TaxID=2908642 RepID=A0AA46TED0_9ACTN|nr:DeoR/GlpR family DNA-binding transcription regulator [Solicola gregarius]UYM03501.1 DeoR/GlpR family DNA-binding transcription regulator [Solicola gregarius]
MATARAGTRTRHATLLTLLGAGTTQVDELAARLGVSVSTVRRDLERLKADGQVERTYGGAMATAPFHERSISESARHAGPAKSAIAHRALELVPASGTVFIDAGTTCGALARLLAASTTHADLTVVTRGLETAVALADAPDIDLLLLGGRVRRMSHGFVGPLTDLAIDRLGFDVAFLGADAVDPVRGIGEPTLEETTVKEAVAARARVVAVLADASKLAAGETPAWTRMPAPWRLITDDAAPADLDRRCAEAGVTPDRAR